jgi:hypothetical protein
VLALALALLPLACTQSALLGARQVPVSAAAGGTVAATGDDAPVLKDFKLVLHPGDLSADGQVTLQLGPESEDLNSAGPSVLLTLTPASTKLVHPAELTLPYTLGPGQYDSELIVELEDDSRQPQRIDRALLNLDTTKHLIHCLLPRLGEVHALAPRHCLLDADCGSAGYCHDAEVCRPRYLPDGGMDPEADGGPHHP